MAQNGTGIESGKSEHDTFCVMSRATTLSADFIGFKSNGAASKCSLDFLPTPPGATGYKQSDVG